LFNNNLHPHFLGELRQCPRRSCSDHARRVVHKKSGLSIGTLGDDRAVSPKKILPNILCDQKRIWTFPWRLAQGNDLLPTAAVLGVTAGLVALDPTDTRYFRRTSSFHQFNHVVSGINTSLVIGLVPASFYAVGLIKRDSYAQQTAFLAGEAIVSSGIVTVVMKDVNRKA